MSSFWTERDVESEVFFEQFMGVCANFCPGWDCFDQALVGLQGEDRADGQLVILLGNERAFAVDSDRVASKHFPFVE